MFGSEPVGDPPPTDAAMPRRQPDDPSMAPAPASTPTARSSQHDTELDDPERAARLQADRALVETLRADRFTGNGYEVLKDTLARYGIPVVQAWIRRGDIYRFSYEQGRPVTCSDELREHLSRDHDSRQALAMYVVADALVYFREHALVQGGWSPTGGASLTTFFVGACVQVFPNVFRAWVKEHQDRAGAVIPVEDICELDDRRAIDPARVVCLNETFVEVLEKAAYSERLQHILAERVLRDASNREIAERLRVTEAAIAQQLYRFRSNQKGGADE